MKATVYLIERELGGVERAAWSGDLPDAPAVGDTMWLARPTPGVSARYRVVNRQWVLHSAGLLDGYWAPPAFGRLEVHVEKVET